MSEYIDARGKKELEFIDQCATCKEEYAVTLHLRHQCSDCNAKWLHDLEHRNDFHWDKMWAHFEKVVERMERIFR